MMDKHDMRVPPIYRYFLCSAKKVEIEKHAKITHVDRRAVRMRFGLTTRAAWRRGPELKPVQTANAMRYPNLFWMFLA